MNDGIKKLKVKLKENQNALRLFFCFPMILSISVSLSAADLNLSHKPLFLPNQAQANVFYMLDDSGSMDWSISVGSDFYYGAYWASGDNEKFSGHGVWRSKGEEGQETYYYMFNNKGNLYSNPGRTRAVESFSNAMKYDWRIRSSDFNRIYYDPRVTYKPWPGFSNANFSAVRSNPVKDHPGYDEVRDLSELGFVFELAIDNRGYPGNTPTPLKTASSYEGSNGNIDLWDDHIRYEVKGSGITRTKVTYNPIHFSICEDDDVHTTVPYAGCLGAVEKKLALNAVVAAENQQGNKRFGRNLTQEKQNIANWYQYHRKRLFSMKYMMATVTTEYGYFRYGMSFINNYGKRFVEMPNDAKDLLAHNSSLNQTLFNYKQKAAGTPLRRGLETVGEYYRGKLKDKPSPITAECQHNFALLFSDGYWNGGNPKINPADQDGDGENRTLADVAKYYYDKDLAPGLPNVVPEVKDSAGNVIDSNPKQHMNTYTIAFGVSGALKDTDDDGWPNPVLSGADNWGDPHKNDAHKVDDMWHAAYNGKGGFLAASSPKILLSKLRSALGEIGNRVGSNASVSLNAGVLFKGSKLMQTEFNLLTRKGNVIAYEIEPETGDIGSPLWNAEKLLRQRNSNNRKIITLDKVNNKQIPFRWGNLNTNQKALLKSLDPKLGDDVVKYVRGDASKEVPKGPFRKRNKQLLGPIVHSSALFVGEPNRNYPPKWSDGGPETDYSVFRESLSSRTPIAYVGANDGMLHGFNADTGKEVFAYVPNEVMTSLPKFAAANSDYISTVDGQLYAGDAYVFDSWRTMLVGGFRLGGQGIFSLDVTKPITVSEATLSGTNRTALWEFTDDQDADVGHIYGQPAIERMHNGKWAVIFGNGYNNTSKDGKESETGHAVLYIVDAETGSLIKKLDTKSGKKENPNGLGEPAIVDHNGDHIIDYVYVGDLRGQLWKFDVTSKNSNDWKSAFGSSKPQPLFQAEAKGVKQPITVKPTVMKMRAPLSGLLVHFGTGRYLTVDDAIADQDSVQTFYGIWDNGTNNASRSKLIKRKIMREDSVSGLKLRTTSSNEKDAIEYDPSKHMGWYLDLVYSGDDRGERVISDPVLRNGEIYFTTFMPSSDGSICNASASGTLMVLNARTGGRLLYDSVLSEDSKGIRDSKGKIPSGVIVDTGGPTGVAIGVYKGRDTIYTGTTDRKVVSINKEAAPGVFGPQTERRISTF